MLNILLSTACTPAACRCAPTIPAAAPTEGDALPPQYCGPNSGTYSSIESKIWVYLYYCFNNHWKQYFLPNFDQTQIPRSGYENGHFGQQVVGIARNVQYFTVNCFCTAWVQSRQTSLDIIYICTVYTCPACTQLQWSIQGDGQGVITPPPPKIVLYVSYYLYVCVCDVNKLY